MKILMINVVCGISSTGRICTDLASALDAQGHEVKIAYGRGKIPKQYLHYAIRIGTNADVFMHGIKARVTDAAGFGSKGATKRFIRWVKSFDPDIIHLHNLHGYYINVEELFNYLRNCGKRIIWTLHDCWAFTGHAAYCDLTGCKRWINGCKSCPNKHVYPKSLIDRSKANWKKKRSLMNGIPNMIIVTPSQWLAGLVRQSFLSQYPVNVIHNGVDIRTFRNIEKQNTKMQLNADNKRIILGVASTWDARKGLKDFYELNKWLGKEYKIVLVGLTPSQIKRLPDGITGITRTNSTFELAVLYSIADIYVNPTYEDNYPTTNLEAISCGTPVITYETGGSPESARLYGDAVERGNISKLIDTINKLESRKISVSSEILRNKISVEHMVSQYNTLMTNLER